MKDIPLQEQVIEQSIATIETSNTDSAVIEETINQHELSEVKTRSIPAGAVINLATGKFIN